MARSIQLSVSESELPGMQQYYLQELDKAEKRVQEIRQILAKLKVSNQESTRNSEAEAAESSAHAAIAAKGKGKKKGKGKSKKPRWSEFIMDLLKSKNQLMRVGTIISEAVEEFDIDDAERKSAEQAIYNSLNRLRNVNNEILSYNVPGKKGSYYGLKDWFEAEGKVKQEFEGRVA